MSSRQKAGTFNDGLSDYILELSAVEKFLNDINVIEMNEILDDIFSIIKPEIKKDFKDGAFIVGINGIDCSGKSTFAKDLSAFFKLHEIDNMVIDIDDFNNSSIENEVYATFASDKWDDLSADKYYEKIINYDEAARIIAGVKDRYRLVIVEGIFIYKPQLVDFFDYKLYLQVKLAVCLNRFAERRRLKKDTRPFEIYEKIWLQSHHRYRSEVHPEEISNIVIDNNDYSNPVILN